MMAGTKEGAIKARNKMLARDPNYYNKLGILGGKFQGRKGTAAMPTEKVKEISRKGSEANRRRGEK